MCQPVVKKSRRGVSGSGQFLFWLRDDIAAGNLQSVVKTLAAGILDGKNEHLT